MEEERAVARISRVTFLRAPFTTLYVFSQILGSGAVSASRFVVTNLLPCTVLVAALASVASTLSSPPAGLEASRDALVEHGSQAAYWVVLGILSSVGLGSGLHTFVLFLGPHILRVANAAVLHGDTSAWGRGCAGVGCAATWCTLAARERRRRVAASVRGSPSAP